MADNSIISESDLDWKVIIEKDEDGFFTVTVPALPGCISQGKTRQEALKNVKEAIELHVSTPGEDGIPIKGKAEVYEFKRNP